MGVLKTDYKFAKKIVQGLIAESKLASEEEMKRLPGILHVNLINIKISDIFKYITTPVSIDSQEAMIQLNEIVSVMAQESFMDKDADYKVINAILTASHNISCR